MKYFPENLISREYSFKNHTVICCSSMNQSFSVRFSEPLRLKTAWVVLTLVSIKTTFFQSMVTSKSWLKLQLCWGYTNPDELVFTSAGWNVGIIHVLYISMHGHVKKVLAHFKCQDNSTSYKFFFKELYCTLWHLTEAQHSDLNNVQHSKSYERNHRQ